MYDALLAQQQQAQAQTDVMVESAITTPTPVLVGVEELKLPGLSREVGVNNFI